MREFTGKVGVVTGAGRGIGLAVVGEMARRRMRVVLSDVEAARPEHVALIPANRKQKVPPA